MLLAPFLWIFCEFDEKVLDNLSLVKRLRKKLNAVEDGAGNCIVSVRDIGYKFELNKENEQQ